MAVSNDQGGVMGLFDVFSTDAQQMAGVVGAAVVPLSVLLEMASHGAMIPKGGVSGRAAGGLRP